MKNQTIKLSLLTTAVLVALQSQIIFAQDEMVGQVKEKQKIETITVTSQKRTERLIDVPISVTNVGQEELKQRGVKKLQDISEIAPNISMTGGKNFNAKITIRGVGANSRNIGFDSRVGVYIDGVYLGQSPAVNQGLVDLERVEVLRGPQGTLFGKNTIAGAINLISQEPIDEFEGSVNINAGSNNLREYNLKLNVPLGEATAAKVFLNKSEEDGYMKNTYLNTKPGGQDSLAGRVNLISELSDNLRLSFSGDYSKQDLTAFSDMGMTPIFGGTGHPFDGMLEAIYGDVLGGTADSKYENYQDRDVFEDITIWGSSLTLDYDMDNDFAFKSITAYRDTSIDTAIDSDHSYVDWLHTPYTDAYQQTSQEFQLISPDGRDFKYILGAYLFSLDSTTVRAAIGGPEIAWAGIDPSSPVVSIDGKVDTSSYALFSNGSYDLSEDLVLGFGLRYSSETKAVDWSIDGDNSGGFKMGTAHLVDERTDTHLSPSLNINYSLSENSQTYARVSTGFKSGGYNLDFVSNEVIEDGIDFDKETVTSYELGYKAELMDYRLRLNASLFYAAYEDYQVNQYIELVGGTTALSITNAAEVLTQGFELEVDYQMTDNFNISGSLGLLDATFDSFIGGGANGSDASGNQLPNAPKVAASLSLQYYQEVAALSSSIMYRVDYNYTGEQYFLVNNDDGYTVPSTGETVDFDKAESFSMVNARISLLTDSGDWEVSLWGRNLTDSDHLTNSFKEFFGGIIGAYAKPRTFGIEAKYNF